jgi:hypothetical protein
VGKLPNSFKDARKSEGYLRCNIDSINEDGLMPRLRSNMKKTSILNDCNIFEEGYISSQNLRKSKKNKGFVSK